MMPLKIIEDDKSLSLEDQLTRLKYQNSVLLSKVQDATKMMQIQNARILTLEEKLKRATKKNAD